MNKVFLNGYLAADPIQRIASTGMEIANIRVAVNDLRNSNDTYFFTCVAFGTQAKYINSNLKKGSFVAIDGRLTNRSYVNNNGQTVYVTEIYIDNLRNFGSRRNSEDSSMNNNVSNQTSSMEPVETSNIHANLDDVFSTNSISNNSLNNTFNNSTNDSETDDDDIDWDDELI